MPCPGKWLAIAGLVCVSAAAQTGAEIARAIRESGVDAGECYRVRNLHFTREDLKFYLTEGYLAFSRPVGGRRISAVFSAEVEGGDAEVILMPPSRSERRSLASFIHSPTLDEHFRSAFFFLGDQAAAQLLARARETGTRDAEAGARLDEQWAGVFRNVSASFAMRQLEEWFGPSDDQMFLSALSGLNLGIFDLAYDPRARNQILAGQYGSPAGAQGRFDVWTSFESRPVRKGVRKRPPPPFSMDEFRIEASLDNDLQLRCVTRARIVPAVSGARALAFQISPQMKVSEARLDGQPVEIFADESPRESAIRGAVAATFLLIAPAPLTVGRAYEVEIRHDGNVVQRAGNGVFFVGSRETWYPKAAASFANYDITFRYPANLTLVGTGAVVADRREGEYRITRRKSTAPMRLAGFNLGDYRNASVTREGYKVEVYSNRRLEDSLRTARAPMVMVPPFPDFGRKGTAYRLPLPPPPDPGLEINNLANDVGSALAYMASLFGPPPIKTLTVSPIPGMFGQGFPGLLYISTLSYLRPQERPAGVRTQSEQTFFSDLLAVHEAAHQWWGNLVTADSTEDVWVMEALANYSALLYLEKRRGAAAVEPVLDEFRQRLLAQTEQGGTVESTGPITWGARLEHTPVGAAWRTITYDKGAWIIHMLRRRMGDERFFRMLAEMCRRFRFRAVTTEDFRGIVKEFMPRGAAVDDFFESWVYGTGIPALKLSYSAKGATPVRLSGTVAQSGVDDGFSCEVPVVIYFAKRAPIVHWVKTLSDSVSFSLNLVEKPVRVVLPVETAVLAVRK